MNERTIQARLAAVLISGALLGATTTLLVTQRQDVEPPPPPPPIVADVPFTLHYEAPDGLGINRTERGWLCDVDTRTAHATCTNDEVPAP